MKITQLIRVFIFIILPVLAMSCDNNDEPSVPMKAPEKRGIMAIGASLIAPHNTWFEMACDNVGFKAYNKAIGGKMPFDYAYKLWTHEVFTEDEWNNTEILVVQFANTGDIFSEDKLKNSVEEYYSDFHHDIDTNPFKTYSHAQNLDFILKYWQKLCREDEFNPKSKWYNVAGGKPFKVILVTHWHDARVNYNQSIRKVAEKWNAVVCELDKNIGFTKDVPLPSGRQVSMLYAVDSEIIDGVKYGWHPKPYVKDNEDDIQLKMSRILTDTFLKSNYLITDSIN